MRPKCLIFEARILLDSVQRPMYPIPTPHVHDIGTTSGGRCILIEAREAFPLWSPILGTELHIGTAWHNSTEFHSVHGPSLHVYVFLHPATYQMSDSQVNSTDTEDLYGQVP